MSSDGISSLTVPPKEIRGSISQPCIQPSTARLTHENVELIQSHYEERIEGMRPAGGDCCREREREKEERADISPNATQLLKTIYQQVRSGGPLFLTIRFPFIRAVTVRPHRILRFDKICD